MRIARGYPTSSRESFAQRSWASWMKTSPLCLPRSFLHCLGQPSKSQLVLLPFVVSPSPSPSPTLWTEREYRYVEQKWERVRFGLTLPLLLLLAEFEERCQWSGVIHLLHLTPPGPGMAVDVGSFGAGARVGKSGRPVEGKEGEPSRAARTETPNRTWTDRRLCWRAKGGVRLAAGIERRGLCWSWGGLSGELACNLSASLLHCPLCSRSVSPRGKRD